MAAYCGTPATLILALPASTLDLMDAANGFRVAEVDLGYPAVRADTSPIPDRNGEWDNTANFGARVVSVKGSLIPSGLGSRQKAFDALAPFLVAMARPTLTYVIDGDETARTLTLRPAQFSGPYSNPTASDFQVQWSAPDPAAYSAVRHQTNVAPGGLGYGRTYTTPSPGTPTNVTTRTYPRVYPATSGQPSASVVNAGNLRTDPLITIYGPATNPAVYNDTVGQVLAVGSVSNPFTLAAADVLTVDGRARAVYLNGNPNSTQYAYVDFTRSSWWQLTPGANTVRYVADTATPASYATVAWNDAFL
jgi:hypothetical protein